MKVHFPLNKTLEEMAVYTSKSIAKKAAQVPNAINLSFGEPEFGPPEFLKPLIKQQGLSWKVFLHSVKGYEQSKGSLALREAIAGWYKQHYGVVVDPEREIMITHGGVEAINLAVQCTTQAQQGVIVSHPSYMLYERAVTALNRKAIALNRACSDSEYYYALEAQQQNAEMKQAGAIIVNSPENPSGYILNAQDWDALASFTQQNGIWLIHDEVYDVMAYSEQHQPALKHPHLRESTIMINSFSKKFGIPGLRIGWMIANERVINMAAKLHDYFYLGVNKQYEQIALLILREPRMTTWLDGVVVKLQARMKRAISELNATHGFKWTRPPPRSHVSFPRGL